MRVRLPQRRRGIGFTIPDPHTALSYDVMVGFDPEGQPKEVFVSCNKVTTAMDIAGRDIGTLISIALQHGVSLAELAAAMTRDDDSSPQGVAGVVLDAMVTL